MFLYRYTQDVSELEAIAEEMVNAPKPIVHVTFKDGSDSHPGRSMARDQAETNEHAYQIHQLLLQLVLNHTIVLETVRDSVRARRVESWVGVGVRRSTIEGTACCWLYLPSHSTSAVAH
jgi:hypothetical protein